jgi:hypothetical protein
VIGALSAYVSMTISPLEVFIKNICSAYARIENAETIQTNINLMS